MDHVEVALNLAWSHVRAKFERDPRELRRRLTRRGSALMRQHPRAWCLAVRATDTRLDQYTTESDEARDPTDDHVTLTAPALRRLCAPVRIDAPGQTLAQVAAKLGTAPNNLLDARLAGVFDVHHVAGLGGYWGRPRPLLYTRGPLDPAARSFRPPDPVWSHTARGLVSRIPPDLVQTLTRVPHHQHATPHPRGRGRDPHIDPRASLDDLHPEHPALDRPPPRGRDRDRRLPAAGPDYVWYKWRGDEYVGYDWRNVESILNHHARQERLAQSRKTKRKQRLTPRSAALREWTNPKVKPCSENGPDYRGQRWLCPVCGKKVNLLFYPLPRPLLLLDAESAIVGSEARSQKPAARMKSASRGSSGLWLPASGSSSTGFACEKCHRIKRLSRCDKNSWNELITYLSAGLLYGREVPRPSWYKPTRKLAYAPRPRREPSKRREQVEHMILKGLSFKEMASVLSLSKGTVLWHAQQVYKQHGVHTLPDLLRKHGLTPKLKKREEVRQRLAKGQPVAQIAREMGISAECVYNHVYMLRRSGAVPANERRGNIAQKPAVLRTSAN